MRRFAGARQRALERDAVVLQPGMKAHGAEAHRALAHRRVMRRVHRLPARRSMKSCSTLSSMRSTSSMKRGSPLHCSQVSKFTDDRQHTAVRARPRWSRPVGSRISLHRFDWRTLRPELALVRRELVVGRVAEQQVRLAGLQPRLENLLPELARRHVRSALAVLRAAQRERQVVAHRVHEFVGDADAVVQVQALAIEVARGFADLDELLDLRVVHVEVHGRRAAPQRALRDRQRQRIHDAHERNDSRGLAAALARSRRWSARRPSRCRCRRRSTPATRSRSRCRRCRRDCLRPHSGSRRSAGRAPCRRCDRIGVAGMNHSRDM